MILMSLVATVVVFRRMGPQLSGDFALAESFLVIWQSLDLTGVGTSTSVKLAIAIGERNDDEIRDLLAFYVKVNVAINLVILVLIAVLGSVTAALLYNGNTRIVLLAVGLAIGAVADGLYGLVIIALQSRRSMRTMALMQNANQAVLTGSLIVAALIRPTPESLMIARVFYSYSTLIMALVVYERLRNQGQAHYPPIRAIVARARTVSARKYWRFGVANAIDKNIASLFTQLPIQLVGIYAGAGAVGYLDLAMSAIGQAGVLTSAVMNNVEIVVPQAVGRRDFRGLWHNFRRVLLVMTVGSLIFFGALALFAPLVIPPVLGARWLPAIPALAVLTLYGAITTIGGLFGTLYRTFDLMGQAIGVKVIALVVVLPLGALWLSAISGAQMPTTLFFGMTAAPINVGGAGAAIGGWIINLAFGISVALTALITLPELRKRAT